MNDSDFLLKHGAMKSGNIFTLNIDKIKIEDGFNLRLKSDDLQKHIDNIKKAILQNIEIPPIIVRIKNNEIIVVDGHCRLAAYQLAKKNNKKIKKTNIILIKNNETESILNVINSGQGRPLNSIEMGIGFKKLLSWGWNYQKISEKTGKGLATIYNFVMLANLDRKYHELITSGQCTTNELLNAIRKHKENAYEVLIKELKLFDSNHEIIEITNDIAKSTLKKNIFEEKKYKISKEDQKKIFSKMLEIKSLFLNCGIDSFALFDEETESCITIDAFIFKEIFELLNVIEDK